MGNIKIPDGLSPTSGGDVPGGRYGEGWRQGKPVEDPAKMKRWGFITA